MALPRDILGGGALLDITCLCAVVGYAESGGWVLRVGDSCPSTAFQQFGQQRVAESKRPACGRHRHVGRGRVYAYRNVWERIPRLFRRQRTYNKGSETACAELLGTLRLYGRRTGEQPHVAVARALSRQYDR